MQAERIPDTESRWIQLGLIAFVIVALLAVAIYVWGSPLTADTQQGARTSSAVAGVKAPRPVDRVLRGGAVAGVKAPRPVDRVLRGGGTA